MLLMVEKEIRGGICHAIHKISIVICVSKCVKANNKYMKN